jgi:hypothetical protein
VTIFGPFKGNFKRPQPFARPESAVQKFGEEEEEEEEEDNSFSNVIFF